MTIQIHIKGTVSTTEPFPGRIGWLNFIETEFSESGTLLGARLYVAPSWKARIFGLLPKVGKKYSMRLPLDNERNSKNYLPREVFSKPSLEQLIWMYENDVDGKALIEGDIFGVESYNTQISILTRDTIEWKIYANNLWMKMQKLRKLLAEISMDNQVDIKERLKEYREEIDEYRKTMPLQGPMGYRGGGISSEQMRLLTGEEERESVSPPPEPQRRGGGKTERIKEKLRRGSS